METDLFGESIVDLGKVSVKRHSNLAASHPLNIRQPKEGFECGDCVRCLKIRANRVYYKCSLYQSRSSSSDIRKRGTACDLFIEKRDDGFMKMGKEWILLDQFLSNLTLPSDMKFDIIEGLNLTLMIQTKRDRFHAKDEHEAIAYIRSRTY